MQNMISISLLQEPPCTAVFQSGAPVTVPRTSGLPQRLAAAKADAAALPGFQPESVVAVVPTSHTLSQRSKLVREARQAGLKVKRFLTPPAAAALMDSRRKKELYEGETEQSALICSLVGNTFDAAIASLDQGIIEILSTSFAENATPETVDRALRQLLDTLEQPESPFSRILMVGDAYYFPGVQERLNKYIDPNTLIGVYSDEELALGGAVLCGILEGKYSGPLLVDALPHSISILTENNTLTPMLAKDSTIPCFRKQVFTNSLADQSTLRLWLYEGEGTQPTADALAFCIRITDAPRCPAGSARIEITLSMDTDGFLQVDAKDLTTGKALTLERSTGETGSTLRPLSETPEQPEPTVPLPAQDPEEVRALVLKFLPVYDDLQLALDQPTTDAAFKKGVELTMKKLTGIFRELGVELYGEPGETFDPRIHNAVLHMKSDQYADNTIVKVLQKGAKLHGKIIRFAMVQVAN